jgi:hypothetical protein
MFTASGGRRRQVKGGSGTGFLLCLGVTAVLVGAATATAAYAGSAEVRVTATVKRVLHVTTEYQAGTVRVDRKDVERGYVDVPAGTVYRVRTNDPRGYLLYIQHLGGPFGAISILDGTRQVELAGMSGMVPEPYSGGPAGERRELSYRLFLSPDARPGTYPWPLLLEAR